MVERLVKNMKRNFLDLVLVAIVFGSLTACGGQSDDNRNNRSANSANASTKASGGAPVNNANMPQSGPLNANNANASTVEIIETPESISAALLQMEDAWNAAYGRRDEAWFQQNLADDYTEIGDDGKTINDKAG